VKIDTVPPAVTITTPANNATYILNASAASSYGCSDPSPSSGGPSCTGTVPSGSSLATSTVGPKTFAVTATDNAGNTTTVTNTYYVVYKFVLSPPKTPANQGSAVPLNWQLKDANGVLVSEMTSLIAITSYFTGALPQGGVCSSAIAGPNVVLYSPASGATGGSNFRQVSGGYQFNWDTTTAQATGKGCYTIVWQFKDNAGPAPAFSVLNPSLLQKTSVQLK
jgi:hypothetical protein